ncbi:flagellar assembly protein FliH [Paenibacillus sp. UNCCL117]|uniref:FliH/SctL family protein n=1 Tax=unclassified Paenibacillus TaxID=185978 RepID=UPI00087F3DAF|nr:MULTISPECIES: FliH/SctL family protein [unclassified Paenibacillus]SDC86132.1 flagellar assembly protein FliH [Paenibacillus sp. cl123]SFW27733.1 flagellar assembly protein FliH [Paenibacillus sp. UNCCL117]
MSNVIKYFQYVPVEDTKIVEHPPPPVLHEESQEPEGLTAEQQQEIDELHLAKEQIIQDAQAFAEEQVRAAMEEAAALKEHAQQEIDGWWQERRQHDQSAFAEAKDQGFRQGYEEGRAHAEAELRERYDQMLQEASQILQQSYLMKHDIIQEAEPFLIEMSCSIAEKIIARQLTLEPEWVKDLIRKVLARRREQGLIALCVAPSQFAYIQDAREELLLHIDSQAELQIIPDGSVQDLGCVIRSSFGSIDARIDTQLNEIKQALQQLASRDGEE